MKRTVVFATLGMALAITGVLVWQARVTRDDGGAALRAVTESVAVQGTRARVTDARAGGEAGAAPVATQLQLQAALFDAALSSTLATLQPGRTNITEEEIARIFSGLHDPTHIIAVLDAYTKGTSQQRNISKQFFEYMLAKYPDERLQACGHYMLALCEEVTANGAYDLEALNRRIGHLTHVIELPSRRFWYSVALDMLGFSYLLIGNANADERPVAYGKALQYYSQRYEFHSGRPDDGELRDECLCDMLQCFASVEEKQVFFDRHRTHQFSSPEWKSYYIEKARFYGIRVE